MMKNNKDTQEELFFEGNRRAFFVKDGDTVRRLDGRGLMEVRDFQCIPFGTQERNRVSCLVSHRDLELVVTATCLKTNPYADSPNKGTLQVDFKLHPSSSDEFRSSFHQREQSDLEYSRVIDKILRSSGCINLEGLHRDGMTQGIKISILVLRYDGGVFPAAAKGIETILPSLQESMGDFNFYDGDLFPTFHHFSSLRGELISDPTFVEETFSSFQFVCGVCTIEGRRNYSGIQLLNGNITREELKMIGDYILLN